MENKLTQEEREQEQKEQWDGKMKEVGKRIFDKRRNQNGRRQRMNEKEEEGTYKKV